MNKYELALVVSAKVEDEVRNATVEKAKEYITSLGGTITNVDEWGKKKLAWVKAFITLFSSTLSQVLRLNWNRDFALWTTCSDTYA